MTALMSSGDNVSAALVGSKTSHMGEPVNRSLLKWKLQVKLMTTRITVVRRFARTYRAKSFQCGIAPGLTAASPQSISKVKNHDSKSTNLSTGALFSSKFPFQDATKQKSVLRTSEKKNGKGFSLKTGEVFKDHLAFSAIQLLLTLFTFQIVKEADLDEAIGVLIIVTVITLASKQEGTRPTYNLVARTVSPKGLLLLLLLLCLGNFEKRGVNAQADSEYGNLECPNERTVDDVPYNVQLAAWTFVAGFFMMVVINGIINRRPLVPAAAAAPPAVPVPPIPNIGFVNVMNVLEDNPAPARRSDPNWDIPPPL